ncbi:MAG TPA: Zn-ribbon containing protein [Candidatus Paceibacterota bacterium]|nr:Zn-ribbon containing protein [Candidatus Paceibacterota bacterium]
MPHQCVHCSKVYPNASKELLEGCSCGSHFFFFISEEKMKILSEKQGINIQNVLPIDFPEEDKKEIEQEVREIMGIEDEEEPVILDLESIRVLGPGKFEIDIVNLFNKKRPVIYKLEEGKYIIDIVSGLKDSKIIDINNINDSKEINPNNEKK